MDLCLRCFNQSGGVANWLWLGWAASNYY